MSVTQPDAALPLQQPQTTALSWPLQRQCGVGLSDTHR